MSEPRVRRTHQCDKCGKHYASMMRLQHHLAAEHAIRTLKDIRTSSDISVAPGRARRVSGLCR